MTNYTNFIRENQDLDILRIIAQDSKFTDEIKVVAILYSTYPKTLDYTVIKEKFGQNVVMLLKEVKKITAKSNPLVFSNEARLIVLAQKMVELEGLWYNKDSRNSEKDFDYFYNYYKTCSKNQKSKIVIAYWNLMRMIFRKYIK